MLVAETDSRKSSAEVGGITSQMLFVLVVDIAYDRVNWYGVQCALTPAHDDMPPQLSFSYCTRRRLVLFTVDRTDRTSHQPW